ncbi:coiled-coil domain-containing protein 178-like [Watersipora subatra]|uniref:coiled-coil domain-containing protein 178-like n=1 Tax=Watersipora subatra TaxID=2589382 RepID=UPI00355B8E4C
MIRTTRSPGIISVSHTEKNVSSHNNDDESQLLALQKGISKRPSETDSQIENDSEILKAASTKKMLLQVEKKPSCTLTNVVSTCVNKASSHLELLQTLIEEWFDQASLSKCSGHNKITTKDTSARSQARFKNQSAHSNRLSIDGQGFHSESPHSIAKELPYLGGMEVIAEVFALIERLDNDVQQTQKELLQEKHRARFLQKKTNSLALRRAVEFPIAVQTEHDAAVEDLSELNWHVTYKLRAEQKLKDRVEHSNTLNNRLLDDIAHVEKHCPLVKEKLSLELQAMEKINEAQDLTQTELEQTLDRLAKTKIRNEEAHMKAETERENMAKEIEDIKKELQLAVTELADSRRLCNTYTHQTSETRIQISENVEEKQVLLVKVDNAKMVEQMQNRKVDELTNKIRMVESEHHRLEEEAFKKEEELTVTRNTMESEFSGLKTACEHEEVALKAITQEVENLLVEIDNLTRKIAKCETGIAEDEKVLRRMNNQIHNTEMAMNQMLDEFTKVQVFNSVIKDKLQEEKERISQIEEALRLTLETLRKQCKDEIHTRTVLHTRITSDGTELVKSQAEAKHKKQKLSKTVVEIEEQLKVVGAKVEKLRDVYGTKQQILDELLTEIKDTQEAKDTAEKEFVETKAELNPYLKKLKEDSNDLKQQLAKLTTQMEMMARKKDEMDHTARILTKSIRHNETAVERLKKDLEEANIQLEAKTNITNSLISSRDDVVRRLETRSREHQQLMTERSVTIQSHTKTLQTELSLNKGLAMRYRQLQGQHVDMKSKVMDMFDERNRLEAGIKDLKQLKGLQSRMHRALETYYKFRGMFNSGELERVQAENRISGKKLANLQEHFNQAVGGITEFLHIQMKVLDKRDVVQEFQAARGPPASSSTSHTTVSIAS